MADLIIVVIVAAHNISVDRVGEDGRLDNCSNYYSGQHFC